MRLWLSLGVCEGCVAVDLSVIHLLTAIAIRTISIRAAGVPIIEIIAFQFTKMVETEIDSNACSSTSNVYKL